MAVSERAEERAERDRRDELGEQDRADRPGRVRHVVGEQQQRDVADRVADRGLKRRRQEGPHAAGCLEKLSHVGPPLGARRWTYSGRRHIGRMWTPEGVAEGVAAPVRSPAVPLKDNLRERSPAEKRDEREELGFLRQPAVRWLSPGLLARSGVEVLVSGTFGKFADKREIQREPQGAGLDYSEADAATCGSTTSATPATAGTRRTRWRGCSPRTSLDFDGEKLPRGKVLLLGGDQVYPTAEPVAYENRFSGPFAAALP